MTLTKAGSGVGGDEWRRKVILANETPSGYDKGDQKHILQRLNHNRHRHHIHS